MPKIIIRLLSTLQYKNIQALLLMDCILLPLALWTSVLLRLGGIWDPKLNHHIWIFVALPLWTIPLFIYLGLYRAVIRYLDEKVILIVFCGVSLSVLILIGCIYFVPIIAFPKTSIIIFWVFALAYIGGTRFILRGLLRKSDQINKIPVAIYGAGAAGVQLCVALHNGNEYEPVFLLDDNSRKWGQIIRGIPVHNPDQLKQLITQYKIQYILLAIPSASATRQREIINFIEPLSIKIKTLPSIEELISGQVTINDIKEIEIEDLLGREPVQHDKQLMRHHIYDKTVLITGAGGSIGSELVRQIAQLQPKLLLLLDMSEFHVYCIEQEITSLFPNLPKVVILGNITDELLLDAIMHKYYINSIYHAAAYKHVPLVEFNQLSSIQNNIIGTYNIALYACKYNIDIVVLISTDKAVRPTNLMGATKRVAEMIFQAYNNYSSHTRFTMVRFGNVLGSSGSVVPLFREQIKQGGPITVTHPEVLRYFMTITEAVELVIQASNMAHGGEVFLLDMGEPVKIIDLAIKMIHLSGLTVKNNLLPNGDIEIIFSGLRPGEKLYEELLISNNPDATAHPRIMKSHETFLDYNLLHAKIIALKHALAIYDANIALSIVQQLVVDYIPGKHQ